ncbi:MAG: hypothetical protein IKM33_05120 [Clostridia bacterium]|nr:hypothetical protein [Clostridia bacterium]
MKNETLYEALGDIKESYIRDAHAVQKKKPTARFFNAVALKWGAMAAGLCLVVTAVVFVLSNNIAWGPTCDGEQNYGNTISYVGWSEDPTLYDSALNRDLLQNEPGEHLPIFKIDTLEELEQFKATFENIVALDQGYDTALSFNAAMSKAQWDRDIFYEKNSLLIIYIPASSGSFRYAVQEIKTTDTSICIHVKQANDPEVITEDMAGWFLLVEVEDEEIPKYTSLDAVLAPQ